MPAIFEFSFEAVGPRAWHAAVVTVDEHAARPHRRVCQRADQ
ncbi:hypothetical protein [Pseudactinotalea sp. HY158]|nr:hypothetical protein [Pseudactinotalea sp. HY158]